METPGKLFNENFYYHEIVHNLNPEEYPSGLITVGDVAALAYERFEPRDAEIITRRLLGQLLSDIADQMQVDLRLVNQVVRSAPNVFTCEGQQKYSMVKLVNGSFDWVVSGVQDSEYQQCTVEEVLKDPEFSNLT